LSTAVGAAHGSACNAVLSCGRIWETAAITRWISAHQERLPGGPQKCGFCGKTRREVGALVKGPSLFICDQCIDLAAEIALSSWPASGFQGSRRSSGRGRDARQLQSLDSAGGREGNHSRAVSHPAPSLSATLVDRPMPH
jgi:hypothetical protein